MVNINEDGRKEYEQPKMKIVVIEAADIIATSNPTGTGRDFEGDPDWNN